LVAWVPSKTTVAPAAKPVPVIVTVVPPAVEPDDGAIVVIVGGWATTAAVEGCVCTLETFRETGAPLPPLPKETVTEVTEGESVAAPPRLNWYCRYRPAGLAIAPPAPSGW